IYSTFLGCCATTSGRGIALGPDGSAYVIGTTSSSFFPTTPDALQNTLRGFQNAVVVKFSPTGALVFSTYLGGSGAEGGLFVGPTSNENMGIALNGAGTVYVQGNSTSTDFPVQNALQHSSGGMIDVFVTKMVINQQ